jgi:hypothetical protein
MPPTAILKVRGGLSGGRLPPRLFSFFLLVFLLYILFFVPLVLETYTLIHSRYHECQSTFLLFFLPY